MDDGQDSLKKADPGKRQAACMVLPVIHHRDARTTLAQARLAAAAGADGVFLISHGGKDHELGVLGETIREELPRSVVGVNYLRLGVERAMEDAALRRLHMVWADDCGVSSRGASAQALWLAKRRLELGIEVFASVAFKYQAAELDAPAAARVAADQGFIPTTSGVATGSAPTVEKVSGMSKAVQGKLAVASGMTAEIVSQYVPWLSHILVSTGISSDEHHFNEHALGRFVRTVRAASCWGMVPEEK